MDVHRIHARVARAFAAPAHHGFHVEPRTLEDRLDPPVGRVPDPSRHAEGTSLLGARGAEEHPLDTTGDEHVDALHRVSVRDSEGRLPV